MPKLGWLERQPRMVEQEVKDWPEWMREEAGLEKTREASSENGQPRATDNNSVGQDAKSAIA